MSRAIVEEHSFKEGDRGYARPLPWEKWERCMVREVTSPCSAFVVFADGSTRGVSYPETLITPEQYSQRVHEAKSRVLRKDADARAANAAAFSRAWEDA